MSGIWVYYPYLLCDGRKLMLTYLDELLQTQWLFPLLQSERCQTYVAAFQRGSGLLSEDFFCTRKSQPCDLQIIWLQKEISSIKPLLLKFSLTWNPKLRIMMAHYSLRTYCFKIYLFDRNTFYYKNNILYKVKKMHNRESLILHVPHIHSYKNLPFCFPQAYIISDSTTLTFNLD